MSIWELNLYQINFQKHLVKCQTLKLKMPRKALIVVDMQNDFLTGTLALSECPAKQVSFVAQGLILIVSVFFKTSHP